MATYARSEKTKDIPTLAEEALKKAGIDKAAFQMPVSRLSGAEFVVSLVCLCVLCVCVCVCVCLCVHVQRECVFKYLSFLDLQISTAKEAVCLVLAGISMSPWDVLLLDDPTSRLDFVVSRRPTNANPISICNI